MCIIIFSLLMVLYAGSALAQDKGKNKIIGVGNALDSIRALQ
jgi:hypothetical protein